jgi:hypothetical protein
MVLFFCVWKQKCYFITDVYMHVCAQWAPPEHTGTLHRLGLASLKTREEPLSIVWRTGTH